MTEQSEQQVPPPADRSAPPTTQGPIPAERSLGDDATVRMLLPVGRSPWAIAAGYLGLFSLILIPAPLAIIVGIVAIIDIRRHPARRGMGRAIFGLVMGVLGTGLGAWMLMVSVL